MTEWRLEKSETDVQLEKLKYSKTKQLILNGWLFGADKNHSFLRNWFDGPDSTGCILLWITHRAGQKDRALKDS